MMSDDHVICWQHKATAKATVPTQSVGDTPSEALSQLRHMYHNMKACISSVRNKDWLGLLSTCKHACTRAQAYTPSPPFSPPSLQKPYQH